MFEDNSKQCKKALDNAIQGSLEDIGKVGTGQSQLNTPVLSGKLKRSQTYKTNKREKHVDIGVKEVDYGLIVHEGSSKQRSQPFLRDAIMNNIGKFQGIVDKHLKKMR